MRARQNPVSLYRISALALAIASLGFVASALAADAKPLYVNSKDIKWSAAPPSMPKGAKIAVLFGNPSAAGPFVLRMQLPKNYKMPFHSHARDEVLSVISGTFYFGNDINKDARYAQPVKPGGLVYLPANANMYAYTKKATVVEVHGEGPFDMHYVNPEDDPQKWAQGETYYFPSHYQLHAPDQPGEPAPTF